MADVALIGLLARVNAQVALQMEVVGEGIGAVRALVGPLPRVAPPNVPLQLTQLHAAVAALRAPQMKSSQIPVRFYNGKAYSAFHPVGRYDLL